MSPESPTLQADSLPLNRATREAHVKYQELKNRSKQTQHSRGSYQEGAHKNFSAPVQKVLHFSQEGYKWYYLVFVSLNGIFLFHYIIRLFISSVYEDIPNIFT